jgi:hypothetical protein
MSSMTKTFAAGTYASECGANTRGSRRDDLDVLPRATTNFFEEIKIRRLGDGNRQCLTHDKERKNKVFKQPVPRQRLKRFRVRDACDVARKRNAVNLRHGIHHLLVCCKLQFDECLAQQFAMPL